MNTWCDDRYFLTQLAYNEKSRKTRIQIFLLRLEIIPGETKVRKGRGEEEDTTWGHVELMLCKK